MRLEKEPPRAGALAILEFKHHHQEPEREKPRREPKGRVDDILGEPKVSRRLVAHSSLLPSTGDSGAGVWQPRRHDWVALFVGYFHAGNKSLKNRHQILVAVNSAVD